MKITPTFNYEKELWEKGIELIAGLDEVGRGCLAGPVVTGAVVFKPYTNLQSPMFLERGQKIFIRDSKMLSSRQREIAAEWIKANAYGWSIGAGTVKKINSAGIVSATNFAFRSVVKRVQERLDTRVQFLLVDAFYIPYIRGFRVPSKNRKRMRNSHSLRENQLAITKGDSLSFSIAAASIIAKVYRDLIMQTLGKNAEFVSYEWGKNKGYGTKVHREAIKKFGPTKHHRTLFIRNI